MTAPLRKFERSSPSKETHTSIDRFIKAKLQETDRKMEQEIERQFFFEIEKEQKFIKGTSERNLKNLFMAEMRTISDQVRRCKEALHSPIIATQLREELCFKNVKEEEKGAYFDEIISFLQPFLMSVIGHKLNSENGGIDIARDLLETHFQTFEKERKKLMETMGVDKLKVPFIELPLTIQNLLMYNSLDENHPFVPVFRFHPLIGELICKFGVFLDRFDTDKEVICFLVWSSVDNFLICLPKVGLQGYPICWNCENSFGTLSCSKCLVARYCSKDCQVSDWLEHKEQCKEIQFLTLSFESSILS